MGRSPSTMTTEPFFCSAIRFDTSASVSEEWAVIAGELITSATVRMVLVAGMPRILPSRVDPASRGPIGAIRQRSPARDTLLTRSVSSMSHGGATVSA